MYIIMFYFLFFPHPFANVFDTIWLGMEEGNEKEESFPYITYSQLDPRIYKKLEQKRKINAFIEENFVKSAKLINIFRKSLYKI